MKGTKEHLFRTAKQGDLTIFESESVDENIVDDDGANCLHYVCRGGNVELAKFLVEKKNFDVSKKTKFGSTCFHEAAAAGNLDIIKWLWSKTEVNIDEQDAVGATPLHIAALYGNLLVVHWIINNTSCDLMLKTEKGALCLHFAVVSGNLKTTKLILSEIPRSINLQLDNGTTPAYLASQCGYLDILKYLVEKGAFLNIKSFDGMSCVHAACQGGHLEVVKWLVKEQKCNSNDRDLDGASCLHFAATNGRARVVEWMIKEGGAKVTLDNLGGSPLHNAAELGHFEVIKALIDNGCNIDITDNEGLTAAELAEKCHHLNSAALIRGEFDLKDTNTQAVISNYNGDTTDGNRSYSGLGTSVFSAPVDSQTLTNNLTNLTYSNSQYNHNSYLNTFDKNQQFEHESTEQESTEYILLERDYPSDDESVSSTESFIIHSLSDSYKAHQISPDNYAPPPPPPTDFQPDDDSGVTDLVPRTTEDIVITVAESDNRQKQKNIENCEKDNFSPLHESDLSSATSTLSYESRQNDIVRSKRSDSSVHFDSTPQYISSPNQSTHQSPVASPRRLTSPSSLLRPETTDTHFSQNQQSVSPDVQVKRTVKYLRDSLQDREHSQTTTQTCNEFPKPSSFSSLGLLPQGNKTFGTPTRASLLGPLSGNSVGLKNMSENFTQKSNLLSELKQLHVSKSGTDLNEGEVNGDDTTTENFIRNTNNTERIRPVSITNGDVSNSHRPQQLPTSASAGNLHSMGNQSPVIGKNFNLVDELKKKDLSDLRVTKKPGEGKQMKMVFSFGGTSPTNTHLPSPGQTNNNNQKETKSKSPILTGEFDPKNFMDKVPETDNTGTPYPAWKKQLLARQLAEKALQESEEKRKEEEYEARFKNMPAWKRQMIERKEAQARMTAKQ